MARVVQELDAGALVRAREDDRAALGVVLGADPDVGAALRKAYPRLGRLPHGELSVERLLSGGTRAFYEDAESRLRLCAECPRDGGACAKSPELFAEGEVPVFTETGVVERAPCERFASFRLGERLTRAGLPRLLHGATFETFLRRNAHAEAAAELAVNFVVEHEPALVAVTGPRGTGKTHLAAAVVRNFVKREGSRSVLYADFRALRVRCKKWQFNSGEPDPLDRIEHAPVLVLDHFELPPPKEQWLRDRVEDVLRARFLDRRQTLVLTRVDPMAVTNALPTAGFANAYWERTA